MLILQLLMFHLLLLLQFGVLFMETVFQIAQDSLKLMVLLPQLPGCAPLCFTVFLLFSAYIAIVVLFTNPSVHNLYATLLFVFSSNTLVTFRMLRVVKCLWLVLELWKLTECLNSLIDFTFRTGIAVAATEPIDMEYLVGLKLLFLMTLSCLTFLLRYNY